MKTLIIDTFVAALIAAALAGCGTVKQQSAMEWMESQPWSTDDNT